MEGPFEHDIAEFLGFARLELHRQSNAKPNPVDSATRYPFGGYSPCWIYSFWSAYSAFFAETCLNFAPQDSSIF